ncbi:MAG: flagellar biosynthetic protein FliO [Myxococcaceae bacterium]|nr:flagellar biosynthetic protein FliO [Myxococcaceae bacterium]MCI0671843.1 flagellar biosynthetic protein FliO [Myxococcaceae bacterium]
MEMLRSPRGKLAIALGLLLLLALALATAAGATSAATIARWVLGGSAAGLGVWMWHRRGNQQRARFALPGRLQVHARAGLSPRCSLALVEADGERFLVAFGEGFATIRRAAAPRSAPPRRTPRGEGPTLLHATDESGGAP